jgi:hypothetical protein
MLIVPDCMQVNLILKWWIRLAQDNWCCGVRLAYSVAYIFDYDLYKLIKLHTICEIGFCYLMHLPDSSKSVSGHAIFFNSVIILFLWRRDIIGALSWGLLLCFLIISSYLAIYFRHFKLSAAIIFLGIIIPTSLHISRQRKLAKKRERRLLLPLSMWCFVGSKSSFRYLFFFWWWSKLYWPIMVSQSLVLLNFMRACEQVKNPCGPCYKR